jgi:hypothetical protein
VPENAGIASLQSDYLQPIVHQAYHQFVNPLLSHCVMSRTLANEDTLSVRWRFVEQFRSDQAIIENSVSLTKHGQTSHCDQVGATGTGADQVCFASHRMSFQYCKNCLSRKASEGTLPVFW